MVHKEYLSGAKIFATSLSDICLVKVVELFTGEELCVTSPDFRTSGPSSFFGPFDESGCAVVSLAGGIFIVSSFRLTSIDESPGFSFRKTFWMKFSELGEPKFDVLSMGDLKGVLELQFWLEMLSLLKKTIDHDFSVYFSLIASTKILWAVNTTSLFSKQFLT